MIISHKKLSKAELVFLIRQLTEKIWDLEKERQKPKDFHLEQIAALFEWVPEAQKNYIVRKILIEAHAIVNRDPAWQAHQEEIEKRKTAIQASKTKTLDSEKP